MEKLKEIASAAVQGNSHNSIRSCGVGRFLSCTSPGENKGHLGRYFNQIPLNLNNRGHLGLNSELNWAY
ncbi:hypothetical protein J53TS2_02020 [Paenibacillus sp. J53TS2]|nr:hypothetical protein J53TS2_02020 [Paenibacillus sp. J53TS2]